MNYPKHLNIQCLIKFLFSDNTNENKTHPAHMPSDRVDFPIISAGNGRSQNSSLHKSGRTNKVVTRMNITSNPLAADGEKVYIAFYLKV